ncbi:MAG: hypothetical protein Q9190_004661 [Brigantiaea leucoxantha]
MRQLLSHLVAYSSWLLFLPISIATRIFIRLYSLSAKSFEAVGPCLVHAPVIETQTEFSDTPQASLLGLPPELLDVIMQSYMGPGPRRLEYMDRIHRSGNQMFRGPEVPPVLYACKTLRYFGLTAFYKDSTVVLFHDNVPRTVNFLLALKARNRNVVSHLHVYWQKNEKHPVDFRAFSELCRLLDSMRSLIGLSLTPPSNAYWSKIRRPLPGSQHDVLVWYRYMIRTRIREEINRFRGCEFEPNEKAGWVRDVLRIRGGGINEFTISMADHGPRFWGEGNANGKTKRKGKEESFTQWLERSMRGSVESRRELAGDLEREMHWRRRVFSVQGWREAWMDVVVSWDGEWPIFRR